LDTRLFESLFSEDVGVAVLPPRLTTRPDFGLFDDLTPFDSMRLQPEHESFPTFPPFPAPPGIFFLILVLPSAPFAFLQLACDHVFFGCRAVFPHEDLSCVVSPLFSRTLLRQLRFDLPPFSIVLNCFAGLFDHSFPPKSYPRCWWTLLLIVRRYERSTFQPPFHILTSVRQRVFFSQFCPRSFCVFPSFGNFFFSRRFRATSDTEIS